MWENAYLSIKNPKASRALKRALDPGRRMLASLTRLRFAMSATFGLRSWGPPLDQILDPHLNLSGQGLLLAVVSAFTAHNVAEYGVCGSFLVGNGSRQIRCGDHSAENCCAVTSNRGIVNQNGMQSITAVTN